jgi:hypothetical protein
MQSDSASALVAAPDESDGWGFRRGVPANTECTALAVLALHAPGADARVSSAVRRGVAWLESRQREDGSWPLSDQVPDASWMTSVAVVALASVQPDSRSALRGGHWLLGQRSRRPTFMQRVRAWLSDDQPALDQDLGLAGWPWTPDTAAWVEPTSWALLALKRMRGALPRRQTEDRIEEAHRLLADRMCRGGGWNYGNKAILGFDLDPYPDTTALALLALQDAPSSDVTEPGIVRLREMLAGTPSTLALALSVLALEAHERDAATERALLRERLPQVTRDDDVRVLALALLALDDSGLRLRVPAHA